MTTKKIIESLKKIHKDFKNGKKEYSHYRVQEDILDNLKQKFLKKPNLTNIIGFVTTLNHFYTTNLGKEPLTVYCMSEFIYENWSKNINLKELLISNKKILPEKLDTFRIGYNKHKNKYNCSRNQPSFATKFFHQFNSQYPIYDNRVKDFISREEFKNFFKKNKLKRSFNDRENFSYTDYYQSITALMCHLKWNLSDVNGFDEAAWLYIKNLSKK